jgi:hypothetical protein
LAAHFRIPGADKRHRTTATRQQRQAKKKANRRAKKGGEPEGQEDEELAPSVRAPSTVRASSSDDGEDWSNPYIHTAPPPLTQEALDWARAQKRRRRGEGRPRAAPAYRMPPPPWEPEDAGRGDGVWIDPMFFPPWRYYEQPSSHWRESLPVLGSIPDG